MLAEIIQPRMEEIFGLVRENLVAAGFLDSVHGGVVVSGGGSQLAGCDRLASIALDNLPVRVGAPHGLSGLADSVQTPIFATAVGLALLAAQEEAWTPASEVSQLESLVERATGWWHRTVSPWFRLKPR